MFKLEMIELASGLLSARALFSFAKIKAFVDAKSILFIRLCRSTSPQVARIAIFLSSFEMELFHISSDQNFLSDYLSRLPTPDSLPESGTQSRYLTEQESASILRQLTLPEGTVLSSDLVQRMLNEDSAKVDIPGGSLGRKRRSVKQLHRKLLVPP